MVAVSSQLIKEQEQRRRDEIRVRSRTTVRDHTQLCMTLSPKAFRGVIRQLNDTIGMQAYEVVCYDNVANDNIAVELFVPGAELAMLLKLTWSNR